jgi:trans-aconitate methyltransferase
LTRYNADAFQHHTVANAYPLRPPYPPETFEILSQLISDQPRVVLDVGTGTGDLARELVQRVDRIDAVDLSETMIEKGKQLPGGDHPKLNWIHSALENASLNPPYALITGGESLHWLDWKVAFPLFKAMLTERGVVAMVERGGISSIWDESLVKLIVRFSTVQNYERYDLAEALEKRKLFQKLGEKTTTPVLFEQTVDDYIESFHSRASFSRERMTAENVNEFDSQLRALVTPYAKNGKLELQITGQVVWGKPE